MTGPIFRRDGRRAGWDGRFGGGASFAYMRSLISSCKSRKAKKNLSVLRNNEIRVWSHPNSRFFYAISPGLGVVSDCVLEGVKETVPTCSTFGLML